MRILHVSHNGLPDPRVEKAALTMKNKGHTLLFLGAEPVLYQNLGAFAEAQYISVRRPFTMVLNPLVLRTWRREIERLKPDVIHAHNIFAAMVAHRTDIPLTYDDHELWSACRNINRSSSRLLVFARDQLDHLLPVWERTLARKHPCIATNENAARVLRRHRGWVGVVRNAPLLSMVENLEMRPNRVGAVYVGADFNNKQFSPHRNMSGLRDALSFDILCGLPHRELMTALTQYRVGLTPWLPHPVLEFKDQNRNYEYMHAGLQVVVNEQIKAQFVDDPFVHGFRDYSTIAEVVARVPESDGVEIAAHAREHYTWEKQESVILEAYERSMNPRR